MAPAAAPTPRPISAPLPAPYPVPAPTAAPAPVPTAAPVAVPQPVAARLSSERPSTLETSFCEIIRRPPWMMRCWFLEFCHLGPISDRGAYFESRPVHAASHLRARASMIGSMTPRIRIGTREGLWELDGDRVFSVETFAGKTLTALAAAPASDWAIVDGR